MPYELLEDAAPKAPETGLGLGLRTGARTLARGAESLLGLPGDIGKAIAHGGAKALSYATEKVTGRPDVFKPAPSSHDFTPTSENIRAKVTKPLTGEYLEPQSPTEEFWDTIVGDAATLLLPVKGKIPSVKKALGVSTVGNVAKWAGEELTGSPLVGTGAKLGAMALANTVGGRKEVSKMKDKAYAEAYSKLPEDAKFDFAPEKAKLEQMIKGFSKGDKPDKKFLLERLNAGKDLINEAGTVDVKDGLELVKGWNEWLQDPSLSDSAFKGLQRAVGIMNGGLDRYGLKNKEFHSKWIEGKELHNALKSTNYMQNLLKKHPVLQRSIKNPLVKVLIGGGAHYGYTKYGAAGLAGIAAAALAAREGAKAYQLVVKSPIARQYYKDLLIHGAANNIRGMAKDISKLDKIADKFIQQNPGKYELLD